MNRQPNRDARCQELLDTLYAYVDGCCEEHKRQKLHDQIEECPQCLESLGIEQQIRELLRHRCGGQPAPQGLRARIVSELHVRYIEVRRD
ncbi:mycothiol system anti-sigma-R factor [Corynebacterium anserum]|uniref:Mycothiol system anti-sigma-R factor n=1 Tax=Corynebacterium anserum TaxID=2684406 RepID=A0A7G7YPM9_9CORY|nr:mycothiol system anti-sigma-R factor [Corynebacterium anserum]MBC2682086.1 mycothiol system anti-sigma-R factor [Corynebacterium anserum]QNH96449.1 mycothiol system anti-sigma-R factor [Corynebacterium anserum]